MSCCCAPEDPEEMPLRDASVRKLAEVGGSPEQFRGYEELPDANNDNNNDNNDNNNDDNNDTSEQQQQTDRKSFCGYGLAFLGVIGISSGLACTQALDKSVPHSELNGFRFSAQFLITAPLLAGFRRCDVTMERRSVGWMSLGAVVLTLSSYMQYGAAYYLPLGVASGVIRSCGLVMNYAISCAVKRTLLWHEFVAAVLCLGGVAMITQPAFLFPASAPSVLATHDPFNRTFWSPCRLGANVLRPKPDANGSSTDRENLTATDHDLLANAKAERAREQVMGYSFCFVEAALSTVYIQLVSRRLSDVNIFVYNFWISLFGSVASFCIMAGSERPVLPTAGVCVAFLVVHMFSAGTHNILLYRAYQLIDPVVAGLILTLQIAFTFILQYTALYRLHPGHANALEISGAVVIFLGNALVPGYQALLSKCRRRNDAV